MKERFPYQHLNVDATGGFIQDGPRITEDNVSKGNTFDAGLDIKSAETVVIYPGRRHLISTGIHLEILPGYVGLIWARSGLAVEHGIMIGAGCIDSTYRGEVKVLLFNMGDGPYRVYEGERIAQLLTVPVNIGMYIPIPRLSSSERLGGFGSSGS